jgi:superfamily II DNA or RNA helicase
MKLYDYQIEAVEAIEGELAFGSKNIILEASTGYGKSIIISELCRRLSGKIAIVVTFEPLVEQISMHLNMLSIDHSILKAGREKEFDETKRIQLIMSQTLHARIKDINMKVDVLLVDERHVEYDTNRFNDVRRHLNPEAIVGFTATPYNGANFKLYDAEIIRTITIKELEERGNLIPTNYLVPQWAEKVNYSGVGRGAGDFSTTQLNEIVGTPAMLDLIVKTMTLGGCKNKKTVVFCVNTEQAKNLREKLIAAGYQAEEYHSKKSSSHNKKVIKSFRTNLPLEGKTLFDQKDETYHVKCLVSVSKVSIGFDVPDIDIGVMLRKTMRRALWVQIAGRVKRKFDMLSSENITNRTAIVASCYNEIDILKQQYPEAKVFEYGTEPKGYDNVIYNARPKKTISEMIDLGQCLANHGFPEDPFTAPEATGDMEENKARMIKATEDLKMDHLVLTLKPKGLNEVTRDIYVAKLKEIKKDGKRLSELTLKELWAKLELETDVVTIMAIAAVLFDKIHCGPMLDKFGRESRGYVASSEKPVVGFLNGNSIEWLAEGWIKVMESDEYSTYQKSRWMKSLKTIIKSSVKNKRNIYSLKFFIETLIERYNEEKKEEEKDEESNKPTEPGIYVADDDVNGDIPF